MNNWMIGKLILISRAADQTYELDRVNKGWTTDDISVNLKNKTETSNKCRLAIQNTIGLNLGRIEDWL